MTVWEAVIKINPADEPARRAREIEEGIEYACALLMDEYELSGREIAGILERVTDNVLAEEERRRG